MKNWIRGVVRWCERGAVALSGFVGYILKEGPSVSVAFLKPLSDFIVPVVKTNAWWLIAFSSVTVGATKLLKRTVLIDPWLENSIVAALDNGRQYLINQNVIQNDDFHHHRLTLYKRTLFSYRPRPFRKWWWWWGLWRGPFSGWLVPVARSGHTTKKVKSTFLAPDDADSCEGVVGRAWACDGLIHIDGLPEINSSSSENEVKAYAKKIWVSEDWVKLKVKQTKPLARSFIGFPIKVNGERWGVVIVDSVRPDGVINPANVSQQLVQLELFIDKILRKGGGS